MRHAKSKIVSIALTTVAGGLLLFQALASPMQAAVSADQVVLAETSSVAIASDALTTLTLSGTVGEMRLSTSGATFRTFGARIRNSPTLP